MDVVATSASSWLPLEAGSVQEAGLTAPIAGTALDPFPDSKRLIMILKVTMNLHNYKEFLYISFFSLDSIPVFCS
jgi:hypothetical protein